MTDIINDLKSEDLLPVRIVRLKADGGAEIREALAKAGDIAALGGGGSASPALLLETGSTAEKISALPAASALDGSEPVPIVQGGATKQSTTQDIADLAPGGGGVTMPIVGTPDATIKGLDSITTASGGQVFIHGGDSSSGPGGGISFQAGSGNAGPGGLADFDATAGVITLEALGAIHLQGNAGFYLNAPQGGGNVSAKAFNVNTVYDINCSPSRHFIIQNLPTSDPATSQVVWVNTAGDLKQSPSQVTNGSATAVAGAATLDALAGTVTSEALVAQVTYTLVLTNSTINANSTVLVTPTNSANLPVTLNSITKGAGTCTIVVGMAALTGTVQIAFAVFN